MHFLVTMSAVVYTRLLVIVVTVISCMLKCAAELIAEDCGDVQYDVENGMVRLPDFSGESIRDLNCSWTYTAPAGRKLLVKVDSVHLPPLELRTSQFQLYIDDKFYDIPRNCVKCLREMVGGKVLNIIFTSYVIPVSESHIFNTSEISSGAEGIGSFQVRYKAFDPHRCAKPELIENGYITNKSRKVGQSIFYHCYPPYDLLGDSGLRCVITSETPVPEWDNKAPKCVIHDCTGEPVIKRSKSGAIASPGFPSYLYQFTTPCLWEIHAQPNHQIRVSITYLKFPKTLDNSFTENISRLSLLDGDYNNYIVNITESLASGSLNFTTSTNKLTVEFVVNEDPKKKEEVGVYIIYSTISSSCPKPRAPENGEVIAYSTDLGSTIAYRCNEGFVLVGELHAECLFNGQWSHPTPSCEPNYEIPLFLSATNDSDIVSEKFADIPATADNTKYPKIGKKKASQVLITKDGQNSTENKEKVIVPKDSQLKESHLKDHQSKDNQLQDYQSKDIQPKDHQIKDPQPTENPPKDHQPKDLQPNDNQSNDNQPNDNQPKDNQTSESFSTVQPYNKITVTKYPKGTDKEFSNGVIIYYYNYSYYNYQCVFSLKNVYLY